MIKMNSFGREIVAHMVEFLYTGNYGTRCFCKGSVDLYSQVDVQQRLTISQLTT